MQTPPSHTPPRIADILAEARTWIGTKWVHHQHVKGVATDCIGLVVETMRAIGVCPDFAYPDYSPLARPGQILNILETYLLPVDRAHIQPADVILIKWRTTPTHLGILGAWRHSGLSAPFSIIHAMRYPGRVIEVPFNGAMATDNFASAWRVPGVV